MTPRACLLVALLASPAWSQQSFDLKSEAVKKIVSNTAATQFALVQVSEKPASAPAPVAKIDYVPPVKSQPVKSVTPRPWPASMPQGPISVLIDLLLDFDDSTLEVRPDRWLSCQWQTTMAPPTPGYQACPAVSSDPLRAR